MSFEYAKQIAALSPEQRLHFYELLAHNLTITIRGIWSEPNLTETEKLDRIKFVNEILHRVTAKIWTLRLNTHEWTESDIWQMIQDHTSENSDIESDIRSAIEFSYNTALNHCKQESV